MSAGTSRVRHLLVPGQVCILQSLLHINLSAVEVNDDEVEVGVARYSIHLLELRNEKMHPATLTFDWRGQGNGLLKKHVHLSQALTHTGTKPKRWAHLSL